MHLDQDVQDESGVDCRGPMFTGSLDFRRE